MIKQELFTCTKQNPTTVQTHRTEPGDNFIVDFIFFNVGSSVGFSVDYVGSDVGFNVGFNHGIFSVGFNVSVQCWFQFS
jgi:hypothetical protein